MLPTSTTRTLLRGTFVLYYALLGGQLLFCLITLFLITQPDKMIADSGVDFTQWGFFVIAFAVSVGFYLNQLRRRQGATLQARLEAKVMHYRTTVIMRSAAIEAGNLFALVLAIMQVDLTPLLLFAAGMMAFIFLRPNLREIVNTYQLSGEERRQLEVAAGR